jgi:hypothetical protein
VLCVWFVGEKLHRVRFDHRALEPASLCASGSQSQEIPPQEATGDYKIVLDEMAAAMNIPEAEVDESKPATRKPRRAAAAAVAPSALVADH